MLTLSIIFTFIQNSREAVLWLAVEHEQKEALDIFAREIAPAGTGMGKWAFLSLLKLTNEVCVRV